MKHWNGFWETKYVGRKSPRKRTTRSQEWRQKIHSKAKKDKKQEDDEDAIEIYTADDESLMVIDIADDESLMVTKTYKEEETGKDNEDSDEDVLWNIEKIGDEIWMTRKEKRKNQWQ